MKIAVTNILIWACSVIVINAQGVFTGQVLDKETHTQVVNAEIHNITSGEVYYTDKSGKFVVANLSKGTYPLLIMSDEHRLLQYEIKIDTADTNYTFELEKLTVQLTEIVVRAREDALFSLRRLRKVEGTSIYAGKKSEVIMLNRAIANIATNNARQIYSQVMGLNIFDSNDGGLQLHIGGRGMNPNRSANFNTRQNGYDISADVLGYPESYYTPPVEALSEIQIVRGAASLQYGTQFGGLVNFKFRQPNPYKKIELTSRQTVGSNNLFASFNRIGGTVGKLSYQAFYNSKRGDGFRPNSGFESHNVFAQLNYRLSSKTKINFESTYLEYLAQQAGGLTDAQFYINPIFSNRSRNWFEVKWLLASAKLEHRPSKNTDISLQLFGLSASRNAVGIRTNRVSQIDDENSPRDVLRGTFKNIGVEAKWLHRYQLGHKKAVALIGGKYYQSNNTSIQGPGSINSYADFTVVGNQFPDYPNQSDFTFPNLNLALFSEQIFYITERLTLTPGIRFESIKTQGIGTYEKLDFDLAGNAIRDTTFMDDNSFSRRFVLLGMGASYEIKKWVEGYANISQNYRSVTFNDIRVVNPSFQIDPNIKDENGFTADIGIRGLLVKKITFDIGAFALLYNDRLGEVLKAESRQNSKGQIVETGRIVRFRGNIGSALMYGLESFIDWNILGTLKPESNNFYLSVFSNLAITKSNYLDSEIAGVKGNQVEYLPLINLKSGVRFGFENFLGSLQYSYMGKQFTDASNAAQDLNDNQRGIEGAIPAYQVVDLSLSYKIKKFKIEGGINNLLNESYFVRRATGYPGPGIIPSAPRTFYLTVGVKI